MRCSIIIPAYNAEATIHSCLSSAKTQSIAKSDYEIILVDDGSTDNTADIARSFGVQVVVQENQGPATARNVGAKLAQGNVLVFTDSDCTLHENFLEHMIAPIEDGRAVGVQGRYKTKQTPFMARFGQVEIETRYQRMLKAPYIDFIGTYAAGYRRDIFLQQGGFDTEFSMASGEDSEFSFALHRLGHKMIFQPEAMVHHLHPESLRHYIRVKFFRGYWRARLYRKHPGKAVKDSYTPQALKLQLLMVLLGLMALVCAPFVPGAQWVLMVVALSFVWFSAPFVKLFKERGERDYWRLPLVLACRALALLFGLGFGVLHELKMGSTAN